MTLTPDAYMDLLAQRREAYYAEHGQPRAGFPALLEWFVQDGDEALVDMAATEAWHRANERPKKPRTYRPASHWRERLEHVEKQIEALSGIQRHNTDDPAAYGGIAIRQSARQRARYASRIDTTATLILRLMKRRDDLRYRLHRAELREAKAVAAQAFSDETCDNGSGKNERPATGIADRSSRSTSTQPTGGRT